MSLFYVQTMSIADWPIISSLTEVFAYIANIAYNIGEKFNQPNVIACIVIFTIITKIFLSPIEIRNIKNNKLSQWANAEINENNKRYSKNALVFYKNKMLFEKYIITEKYGFSPTLGLKNLFIQFPILILMYTVIGNLHKYIPAMTGLSETELTTLYTVFGKDIRERPGFTMLAVFPILAYLIPTIFGIINSLIEKKKMSIALFTSGLFTLIVGFRFATYLSIYWAAQSLISSLINVIINLGYRKKNKEFFINKRLLRLNNSRQKRGLPPLDAPVSIKKIVKQEAAVSE